MTQGPVFSPDAELALMADQVAFLFHVMVGVDAIGDFQAVENISTELDVVRFAEGGRMHSPHLLAFDGPKRHGEITLRWGMLARAKLYDWMEAVELGGAFRRNVVIVQLTRQKIPLRLMLLRGAYPISWQGANLDSTDSNYAVEQLTLVYDDLSMVTNMGLLVTPTGSNRDFDDGAEWETPSAFLESLFRGDTRESSEDLSLADDAEVEEVPGDDEALLAAAEAYALAQAALALELEQAREQAALRAAAIEEGAATFQESWAEGAAEDEAGEAGEADESATAALDPVDEADTDDVDATEEPEA